MTSSRTTAPAWLSGRSMWLGAAAALLAATAVLGLAIFALVSSLATTDLTAVEARFVRRSRRWSAWFLLIVVALFTLLLGALGALWSLLGATRPDRRPAADPLLTAEV